MARLRFISRAARHGATRGNQPRCARPDIVNNVCVCVCVCVCVRVKGSNVPCRSPRSDGARPALTNNLLCVIPNTGAHVCLHLRVPAHDVGVPEACPQTASVVCVLRLKQHRLLVFPVHSVRRSGRPGPPDSGRPQGFSAEDNNAPTISGRVLFPCVRFTGQSARVVERRAQGFSAEGSYAPMI